MRRVDEDPAIKDVRGRIGGVDTGDERLRQKAGRVGLRRLRRETGHDQRGAGDDEPPRNGSPGMASPHCDKKVQQDYAQLTASSRAGLKRSRGQQQHQRAGGERDPRERQQHRRVRPGRVERTAHQQRADRAGNPERRPVQAIKGRHRSQAEITGQNIQGVTSVQQAPAPNPIINTATTLSANFCAPARIAVPAAAIVSNDGRRQRGCQRRTADAAATRQPS